MTVLPWVLYVRVSTFEQMDEGVSIEAQEESCRAYAKARGWTVGSVIADSRTARQDDRPGYQRILGMIRARQIAGVLTWKLKRLTRNVEGTCAFLRLIDENNVGFVAVTESWDTTTPMGRALITVGTTFSQLEVDDIGNQTRLAMRWLKSHGYFTGRQVPSGCAVVDDNGHRRLVAGDGAEQLSRAPGWILAGDSLADVAAKLNAEHVPHRCKGKQTPWTPVNVRSTLLSPQVVDILLSSEVQLRLRSALAGRANPMRRGKATAAGKHAKRQSVLAGLLRCPVCERSMFQVTATGKTGTRYPYFRCCGRSKRVCRQSDLRCEPIEEAVLAALPEALKPDGEYQRDLRSSFERARQGLEAARTERARLTALRDQLGARAGEMVLRQQIGTAAWDEGMKSLSTELERVDRRLGELSGTITAGEVDQVNVELALAELLAGAQGLANATFDQQRRSLMTLVAAVRVTPTEIILDLYEPENDEPPPVTARVRAIPQKWVPRPHGARTRRAVVKRDHLQRR